MSNPIYPLFLEEAQEHLQTLEAGLLGLAQADLAELVRAAHTLKGSGNMVGLTAIPAVAQRLEAVFGLLLRQTEIADRALETLLVHAYDCLESALRTDIQGGQHDEALLLTRAEPTLAGLDRWLVLHSPPETVPPTEHTEAPPAAAADSLAKMLFVGNVAAGLETLAAGLQEPAAVRLEILRSQLDALVSLGELVSMPDFSAIAQTALGAIAADPDRCLELGQQALSQLRAFQSAVLAQPLQDVPTAQVLLPSAAPKSALDWDEASEEALLLELFGESDDGVFGAAGAAGADFKGETGAEDADLEAVSLSAVPEVRADVGAAAEVDADGSLAALLHDSEDAADFPGPSGTDARPATLPPNRLGNQLHLDRCQRGVNLPGQATALIEKLEKLLESAPVHKRPPTRTASGTAGGTAANPAQRPPKKARPNQNRSGEP